MNLGSLAVPTLRPHRPHRRAARRHLADTFREIDDDPVLLCGCCGAATCAGPNLEQESVPWP